LVRCADTHSNTNKPRLLELGCSVGGLSFSLTNYFEHIDAIDMSAGYIQHGVKLKQGKGIRYVLPREGELTDFYEVSLSKKQHDLAKKIDFFQGDIANLKARFSGYDMVLAHNVLERSYDPEAFLSSVHTRLTAKGLLVVISDYSFDEKITTQSKWLGGQKIHGENVTGFEALSSVLSKEFLLTEEHSLLCSVMTDKRHFTLTKQHVSIWQIK
jgi:putative 4-mercaptohistidine N1-methyltranferase